MRSRFAHEIMDTPALTVHRDLPVGELARLLLDQKADGACVMDGDTLVGVVTSMDLLWSEKPMHMPTVITFMDLVFPLGGAAAEQELHKIMGATVGEIMSAPPITVAFDTPVATLATQMIDQHLTLLPVVREGHLLGVVTKASILRAAFGPSEA